MGARLELRHGRVAEADRIAGGSADALVVDIPSIGAKIRSKGNLYLLVSASRADGRAHEATRMIAESIRRDYYYDESAGIPVILEKAIRAADRKVRGLRDAAGTPPGAYGVAVAVIRQGELYVASIGETDVYLVRAARLLMPDQTPSPGLPAEEGLRIDVWRGELAVGDAIVLVARNVTQTVGTEELKTAVVSLHPQSAAEHLHHLFVAAGGEGPDGLIAVEATEPSATRPDRRLGAPSGATDPAAIALPPDAPAAPVGGSALSRRAAALADRAIGMLPRRSTDIRRVAPSVSERERRRRIATSLLGLLTVVLVLGLGIWLFPQGKEDRIVNLTTGERAWVEAKEKGDRGTELVATDPDAALDLCREAWRAIDRAGDGGVSQEVIAPVAQTITGCLDRLHAVRRLRATQVLATDGMQPTALVQGPDGNPFFIDRTAGAVWTTGQRPGSGRIAVREGDGSGRIIVAKPHLLATGGVDLLILDDLGQVWRWRTAGSGTLTEVRKPGDPVLDASVTVMETYLINAASNFYNLYITDPRAQQIHKYVPTGDGTGFADVQPYLAATNEDVSAFLDFVVASSLYTLDGANLVRHYQGRVQDDFALAIPPDDGDLRPGHDYRFVTLHDERFYIWDARWERIVVFAADSGRYIEQWQAAPRVPSLADVRGFYIDAPEKEKGTADLIWVTPTGLYRSPLADDPEGRLTGVSTPEPDATRKPRRTPEPDATKKPRRTPRPEASPAP
ncbi:MAG: hypothetical protein ACKOTZ_01470 [Chloroflexota bacterium]